MNVCNFKFLKSPILSFSDFEVYGVWFWIRKLKTKRDAHKWSSRGIRSLERRISSHHQVDMSIADGTWSTMYGLIRTCLDLWKSILCHPKSGDMSDPCNAWDQPQWPQRMIPDITTSGIQKIVKKMGIHFSIWACHPCAGAMLIFSV